MGQQGPKGLRRLLTVNGYVLPASVSDDVVQSEKQFKGVVRLHAGA